MNRKGGQPDVSAAQGSGHKAWQPEFSLQGTQSRRRVSTPKS